MALCLWYLRLEKLILMKDSNICIGIILFNPTNDEINSLIRLTNENNVYVYVNSNIDNEVKSVLHEKTKYIYCSNVNFGISKAMNHLFAESKKDGFKYFMCLDQDTIINDDFSICEIEKEIFNINAKFLEHDFLGYNLNSSENQYSFQDFIIISGTIFNLEILQKMGFFNENYFVDLVDYEISIRASVFKYKFINLLNNKFFDHKSNQADTLHSIFCFTVRTRRYEYSRIKQSILSYMNLLFFSIKKLQIYLFIKLFRSFLIYIYFRLISIFPIKDS